MLCSITIVSFLNHLSRFTKTLVWTLENPFENRKNCNFILINSRPREVRFIFKEVSILLNFQIEMCSSKLFHLLKLTVSAALRTQKVGDLTHCHFLVFCCQLFLGSLKAALLKSLKFFICFGWVSVSLMKLLKYWGLGWRNRLLKD